MAKKKIETVGVIGTPAAVAVVTMNWETPILEIIQDKKFRRILYSEMSKLKHIKPGVGKKMNSQFVRVIRDLTPERMINLYAGILFKVSKMPAYDREFIKNLVEQCCVKTIKYYEAEKEKK